MKYCFGIDVGGTTVKLGFFKEDGTLVDKWEIPTRKEGVEDLILPDIATAIQDKMKEHAVELSDIVGVGLGIPAAIKEDGYAKTVVNLGWKDKPVKEDMEALLGLPVRVANDANVAALGEMWKGGGEGYSSLVMVTLGTGVGGGIILDGKILTGANGGGGEIGHILAKTGEQEPCGCGKKGCLEQYASATGIARIAKQMIGAYSGNTILNADNVTAKDVFDAVKQGDELAHLIAEEFGTYLGHALASIGSIINPEVFVIGGGVSKAGEILFKYIEKPYLDRAFFTCVDTKFKLAQLGNDAGIYGAAKMALEKH